MLDPAQILFAKPGFIKGFAPVLGDGGLDIGNDRQRFIPVNPEGVGVAHEIGDRSRGGVADQQGVAMDFVRGERRHNVESLRQAKLATLGVKQAVIELVIVGVSYGTVEDHAPEYLSPIFGCATEAFLPCRP